MLKENIKGTLLEYFIRNIFLKAGFKHVNPIKDDYYIFENKGLLFVNGKGAAHDADILMTPPIQLPLIHPTRLLIECKAYKAKENIGLPIIRSLFALREDLNNYEITTPDILRSRKFTKKTSEPDTIKYRYMYQTGIACIYDFTKPAIEFAAKNKIQLFSLKSLWKVISSTENLDELFDARNEELVSNVSIKELIPFLKDRKSTFSENDVTIINLINKNKVLVKLFKIFMGFIHKSMLGVLNTGEYVFLYPLFSDNIGFIQDRFCYIGMINSTVSYNNNWVIELNNLPNMRIHLNIDKEIYANWINNELEEPKIIVFNDYGNQSVPFFEIKIINTNK